MKTFKKYWAVFQITLIHSLAYPGELIGRSLVIIPFMWIFYQLWTTTYAAAGTDVINGLTLPNVLWYLMIAEKESGEGEPRFRCEIERILIKVLGHDQAIDGSVSELEP